MQAFAGQTLHQREASTVNTVRVNDDDIIDSNALSINDTIDDSVSNNSLK